MTPQQIFKTLRQTPQKQTEDVEMMAEELRSLVRVQREHLYTVIEPRIPSDVRRDAANEAKRLTDIIKKQTIKLEEKIK